ncbi:MAG: SDR family NAD(P)-dependent oxidoreductase, partial [Actinomycetota bacterium]
GAATARALAGGGWRVVLIARRQPELREVAEQIRLLGGLEPIIEPLDAADADAVAAMARRVRARAGRPGAVVNSAGAGEWRWPEDTPPAAMERMLDAPYRAAYHLVHAFLPGMLAQRGGVLVHVGSPAALVPWPSATAYTVSRWALRGLHEALRQDLHGTGVHSSHVVFGEVETTYFDVNPDSYRHRPRLGDLVRTISPWEAAQVIVRTIHRPLPQVLHPASLAGLHLARGLAPGLARDVVRLTGRRR